LVGVVLDVFLLEVTGDDAVGELGFGVLAFDSGGTQLVVPYLLVLGTLYGEGGTGELFGI
jgi:hypothetical protein